jgi:hypothetical protein
MHPESGAGAAQAPALLPPAASRPPVPNPLRYAPIPSLTVIGERRGRKKEEENEGAGVNAMGSAGLRAWRRRAVHHRAMSSAGSVQDRKPYTPPSAGDSYSSPVMPASTPMRTPYRLRFRSGRTQ